jgi:hypothetical protein
MHKTWHSRSSVIADVTFEPVLVQENDDVNFDYDTITRNRPDQIESDVIVDTFYIPTVEGPHVPQVEYEKEKKEEKEWMENHERKLIEQFHERYLKKQDIGEDEEEEEDDVDPYEGYLKRN